MSLSTLQYKHSKGVGTRSGYAAANSFKSAIIFDGNPADYHEWLFRVELKKMRIDALLKGEHKENPEEKTVET